MKKLLLIISLAVMALTASAQSTDGYFVGKNFVSYNDSLLSGADAGTFTVLGHGYAKDNNHVYLNGKILNYADPATFSLSDKAAVASEVKPDGDAKQSVNQANYADDGDKPSVLDVILGTDEGTNLYSVSGGTVSYNGKTVKKADAVTFKYIGGEYGADKHHAYYKGRILGDAWGVGQFQYKGNGYATDGVHWYCNGKPVDRD